ncbi:MAG: hypothetical protein GF368_05515 [Candidatus Aenigmarchaeota archaeon]|nr:hypothetical protein [Candidatus Aenigmarchaeota archaeon]
MREVRLVLTDIDATIRALHTSRTILGYNPEHGVLEPTPESPRYHITFSNSANWNKVRSHLNERDYTIE